MAVLLDLSDIKQQRGQGSVKLARNRCTGFLDGARMHDRSLDNLGIVESSTALNQICEARIGVMFLLSHIGYLGKLGGIVVNFLPRKTTEFSQMNTTDR